MGYSLASRNTLIVRGPASVRLLEGEASVLGCPLERPTKLVVSQEKQLPLEAVTDIELDIGLGKNAKIFEIEGSTIPPSWATAADTLMQMEVGKAMIIGATDVGKSTFCTYLANSLLKAGLDLRVVDGDVGQADIGPPTTVGSSIPTAFVPSLVELKPENMIFIGHTSPGPVETRLLQGLMRLCNRSEDVLTIINTDGWALDPEAISYKIRMIRALEPDLVMGLATGAELQPILSHSGAQALNVDAAQEVLARSRSDRRKIRKASYGRFLEGAGVRTVSLRDVSHSTPSVFPAVNGPNSYILKDLIVGLLDEHGFMLQIGILMEVTQGTAKLYCRDMEGVRKIEVGYVRLSTDGTETGYFERE